MFLRLVLRIFRNQATSLGVNDLIQFLLGRHTKAQSMWEGIVLVWMEIIYKTVLKHSSGWKALLLKNAVSKNTFVRVDLA